MEKNEAAPTGMSELQENLDYIRGIYLFSGLPIESLKVLAYMCNREKFRKGEFLFRQEDDDGQAFFIISGTARLVHEDETGRHDIRDMTDGDFFGGIALLGKCRRLFSLQAQSDMVCLVLDRKKFNSTVSQFPDVFPRIIKSLVEQINAWEEHFLMSRTEGCEACARKVGVSLL